MTIYERVISSAKDNGKSIRAVEREAGLSSNSIGKWREHSPRVDSLQKVAQVLNVPCSYLIGEA